jgi:hypothetical protein
LSNPQLESAWIQPLNLKCDIPVSKFAFTFNLYRSSAAHEYLVGGNSPLALLPLRGWALVESINDEVLIEVGVYVGEGGLGEEGWDMSAPEGGESEPRRVIARRYERGGRFASAFFVEESRWG